MGQVFALIPSASSEGSDKPGFSLAKPSLLAYMQSISDFIWNFGKLPFPSQLGKYIIKIGKISTKIHDKVAHTLILCIPMDFPIHIGTISMALPIGYFKGSQEEFS